MLKNYLKVALRDLRRHKGYTLLNVGGLTVALTSALLIYLYVTDELSYDRFHKDADRTYAVGHHHADMASGDYSRGTTALMIEYIRRDIPEVESATHFVRADFPATIVRGETESYFEEGFIFGDSTFFDVLSFPFLAGDPRTELREPHSIVVTKRYARKLFGNEAPYGKEILIENVSVKEDGPVPFRVAGVIDPPAHTSYPFTAVLSKASWSPNRDDIMGWGFVRLREGASVADVAQKLPSAMHRFLNIREAKPLGQAFVLQPLTSVHLSGTRWFQGIYSFASETHSSSTSILVLATIGFFILLVACINYVNLTTARAATRAREVGIRKVMGSTRGQLIRQHFTESSLLVLIALILALGVVELLLPVVNGFLGREITFGLISTGYVGLGIGVITAVVAILAGFYPALVLTRYMPAAVLKGGGEAGPSRAIFRRSLVVFQFAVSITLVVLTVFIYGQLKYAQGSDLGFDKEHLLAVKKPWLLGEQERVFEAELKQLAGVVDVGRSSVIPGPTCCLSRAKRKKAHIFSAVEEVFLRF